MTNTLMLIGKLTDFKENNNTFTFTLAVSRNYKNKDGIYENDFINVEVSKSIGNNVLEYCTKGDIMGVKGRLETDKSNKLRIIAEKITFLSSKKANE